MEMNGKNITVLWLADRWPTVIRFRLIGLSFLLIFTYVFQTHATNSERVIERSYPLKSLAHAINGEGDEAEHLGRRIVSSNRNLGFGALVPIDTISGIVRDETGNPLIGVNIQVKGTSKGTTTDLDGHFELFDVDEGSILVLSYIGYTNSEIEIGENDTPLDIVMLSDAEVLDELVVVGYGTQLKSDLTGSVGTLKGDELRDRPDRKSTRLNSSHVKISYAVFCLKKKKNTR